LIPSLFPTFFNGVILTFEFFYISSYRSVFSRIFLLCVFVLGCWIQPSNAKAETFIVRSTYLNPVNNQWDQEIKWKYNRTSNTQIKIFRENRDQPDMMLTYSAGGGLISITDHMSGMKNNSFRPNERVILSWGFPIPYDFLDPLDNNSYELVLKKKIDGTTFSYHVSREIQFISPAEAMARNMIDKKTAQFYMGKKLKLIIIKKGNSLLIRQLWPEGANWWIFEETDLRRSWHLPY
jgi:hypothetical protein